MHCFSSWLYVAHKVFSLHCLRVTSHDERLHVVEASLRSKASVWLWPDLFALFKSMSQLCLKGKSMTQLCLKGVQDVATTFFK